MVFYPHGSLVLSKGINGTERKIKIEKQKGEKLVARQNRLLDTILDKWKNTKEIPIFVCEGKTEAKEFSINNSTYLNTVYCNVLKNLEENIVIYGWKIGEEDKHLLKAIEISKPKRIAISLFSAKITKNERDIEMSATLSSIENLITKMKGFKYNNTKLEFFYATSPDCWVY